jgi:hypothetical protein
MKQSKALTTISPNSPLETHPLPPLRLYPGPRQQPRTPSLLAYTYNSTHPDYQGPHEEEQHQHVYPPRLYFQRPNEEEQHQHVHPPRPSSSDTHYTTPLSVPQTISPSLSYSHASYFPTAPIRLEFDPSTPINASDYVFPPSPTTVPGRSGDIDIGIDEHKSNVLKVYPAGRFVARPKGSEALKVRVPSGAQAFGGSTSMASMSPLSDLPMSVPLVPPAQVQANHRTPPMVPHHPLHQDDSVHPSSSSLPFSVPASTSTYVPQHPQDNDKDSTSPITSTPTPTPFIYLSAVLEPIQKLNPNPAPPTLPQPGSRVFVS